MISLGVYVIRVYDVIDVCMVFAWFVYDCLIRLYDFRFILDFYMTVDVRLVFVWSPICVYDFRLGYACLRLLFRCPIGVACFRLVFIDLLFCYMFVYAFRLTFSGFCLVFNCCVWFPIWLYSIRLNCL